MKIPSEILQSPRFIQALKSTLSAACQAADNIEEVAETGVVLEHVTGQELLKGAELGEPVIDLAKARWGLLSQDQVQARLGHIRQAVDALIQVIDSTIQEKLSDSDYALSDEEQERVNANGHTSLIDIIYIATGEDGFNINIEAGDLERLKTLKAILGILENPQMHVDTLRTPFTLRAIRSMNYAHFSNLDDPVIEEIITRLKEISGLAKIEEALHRE